MSLRNQVLRGGAYLSVRHAAGLVIGLGGTVLLTRLLGPDQYGLYAAAAAIFLYLQSLSQCGIDVFLVRREGESGDVVYHQAHTVLLALSAAGTLAGLLAIPLMVRWMNLADFTAVAGLTFLALPLAVLSRVPLARLERSLDYRAVAVVELVGLSAFHFLAVALAYQGWGVWSPVAAWWMQHALVLGLAYRSAGYRPRLAWEGSAVRDMVGYGLSYSSSTWIWQARMLVNPLVVGRFAGSAGVGHVALAIRLVGAMSFVATATYRLSIAAFARISADRPKLLRGITEGMHLQLLALGPILLIFAVVGPYLVPRVFGAEWDGVMIVFPFVALGVLVNAAFSLHSSALYVLRRNRAVAIFHGVHLVLFAGAAAVFVPLWGLVGYGIAELVALTSYVFVHGFVAEAIGRPRYALAALWCGAFGLALFFEQLGVLAFSLAVVAVVWPGTWTTIRGYVRGMLGVRYAG